MITRRYELICLNKLWYSETATFCKSDNYLSTCPVADKLTILGQNWRKRGRRWGDIQVKITFGRLSVVVYQHAILFFDWIGKLSTNRFLQISLCLYLPIWFAHTTKWFSTIQWSTEKRARRARSSLRRSRKICNWIDLTLSGCRMVRSSVQWNRRWEIRYGCGKDYHR